VTAAIWLNFDTFQNPNVFRKKYKVYVFNQVEYLLFYMCDEKESLCDQ